MTRTMQNWTDSSSLILIKQHTKLSAFKIKLKSPDELNNKIKRKQLAKW